jgi:hypothetical protein
LALPGQIANCCRPLTLHGLHQAAHLGFDTAPVSESCSAAAKPLEIPETAGPSRRRAPTQADAKMATLAVDMDFGDEAAEDVQEEAPVSCSIAWMDAVVGSSLVGMSQTRARDAPQSTGKSEEPLLLCVMVGRRSLAWPCATPTAARC